MADFKTRMSTPRTPLPTAIHAHILIPDAPHPSLRRTASGHLFMPNLPPHACDKCNPPPGPSAVVDRLRLTSPPDEQVKIVQGPAHVPRVVEKFTVEGKADAEVECHRRDGLRRKGRFVVNHKKSHVGLVVDGGEGEDEGGLLSADVVVAMHAFTVEYTGAGERENER